jgi:hypothetical protein
MRSSLLFAHPRLNWFVHQTRHSLNQMKSERMLMPCQMMHYFHLMSQTFDLFRPLRQPRLRLFLWMKNMTQEQ